MLSVIIADQCTTSLLSFDVQILLVFLCVPALVWSLNYLILSYHMIYILLNMMPFQCACMHMSGGETQNLFILDYYGQEREHV